MEITSWLIAYIPILSFGLIPVVATYIGGKPVEQSMGISFGSLLFAIVFFPSLKDPILQQQYSCLVCVPECSGLSVLSDNLLP